MAFQTKRGRPPVDRPKHDTGTKELAARHAQGFTLEPLDYCLKRQIISEAQHRSGIHLRWLHTLRFGAPTVSAYDASNMGGKSLQNDNDQEWKEEREKQYEAAICALKRINAHRIVMDVCIFSYHPSFLLPARALTQAMAELRMADMVRLREGLDVMQRMFFLNYQKKYA